MPYYQYQMKDRLSYELTFNNYGKVIVSTDTNATYAVSDIHLEYETITSEAKANSLYYLIKFSDIARKPTINRTQFGILVWHQT